MQARETKGVRIENMTKGVRMPGRVAESKAKEARQPVA